MNRRVSLALVLASFYAAQPVHAGPHVLYKSGTVTFSGGAVLEVQAATKVQASKYQKRFISANPATAGGRIERIGITRNNKDIAFLTSAGAYLGAKNQLPSELEYGMQVGLFTNVQAGYLPVKDDYGRTYVYAQKPQWGRIEAGTKKGAASTLGITADDIAVATGGINGGWGSYLNLDTYDPAQGYTTSALQDDNFTTSPTLLYKDNDSDANHEGNRKITYYTPRFSNGIKLGFSYVPDSANRGSDGYRDAQKFPNESGPFRKLRNLIVAVLSWEHKIDKKQTVTASVVGETGRLTTSVNDNLAKRSFYTHPKAYNIGIQYSYDKFDFIISYANRGKLQKYQKQPGGIRDSQFYTAGVAYQYNEKLATSLTYLYSYNRNTLNLCSLGVEYKWMPGFKVYAEATYAQAKQKYNYGPTSPKSADAPSPAIGKTNFKNAGTVFILGAKVSL